MKFFTYVIFNTVLVAVMILCLIGLWHLSSIFISLLGLNPQKFSLVFLAIPIAMSVIFCVKLGKNEVDNDGK